MQHRAHDDPAAYFGSAGVIENRRFASAHVVQKPNPSIRIPRLAGGEGDSQLGQVVLNLDSYWNIIPNVWVQGDFATIDADGLWYLHGRSDDTIKVAGKRLGPTEVESLLVATGKIVEAAAIGVPDEIKGQALVCVCVPATGTEANPELVAALSEAVVHGAGPGFRPKVIVLVSELPKTRSMKIMRRVVRAIYVGAPQGIYPP